MNRLRKKSVLIALAFVFVLFYTVSVNASVRNPILKLNTFNSMTSKTDITINLSASGLSKENQQNFHMLQPLIDNLRISTVTKFSKNKDNTLSNQYMHLMINAAGTPLDTSIWAKTDLTCKVPSMKEIVRVSMMLKAYLPAEAQGKEYAVLDLQKQNNEQVDIKKLASACSNLSDAITNSTASFKPGFLSVRDRGTSKLDTGDCPINVHNYTLRLGDTAFKQLIKYSVNNLAANKDVIAALKDYLAVSGMTIDKEIPSFIKDFNASMDKLKNTKIVGRKGIIINYSVNSKGYIVNTDGIIDLTLNTFALSQSKTKGSYNLTIKFNQICIISMRVQQLYSRTLIRRIPLIFSSS